MQNIIAVPERKPMSGVADPKWSGKMCLFVCETSPDQGQGLDRLDRVGIDIEITACPPCLFVFISSTVDEIL
jgi:hypothetical protein